MRFRIPGIERERFLVTLERNIELALALQHVSNVVVRLGVIRLKRERLAKARDRFVQIALILESCPQIVTCLRIIRPQFQRPLVGAHRFIQFPLILERNAQVVVRLGVIGIERKGFALAGDCIVLSSATNEGLKNRELITHHS